MDKFHFINMLRQHLGHVLSKLSNFEAYIARSVWAHRPGKALYTTGETRCQEKAVKKLSSVAKRPNTINVHVFLKGRS